MKINKKTVEEQIESAIANGVVEGEEVDVTTKKIMEVIQPLFNAVESIEIAKQQVKKPPF